MPSRHPPYRPLAVLASAMILTAQLLAAGPALAVDLSAIDLSKGATVPPPADRGKPSPPAHKPPPPAGNPPPGCSRASWLAGHCGAHPGLPHPHPPYPGERRRPVVIVPPAAPVDETPPTDDWEGCRKTKLKQLDSTRTGNTTRARQMEEWLWKNCRAYSDELRQLEQDSM